MTLEERMFRQQQRDWKNPYKEGSAQWRAWGSGHATGMVAKAIQDVGIMTKYHELLYAVARKPPGESRHGTALRYIRAAESQSDNRPCQAGVSDAAGGNKDG